MAEEQTHTVKLSVADWTSSPVSLFDLDIFIVKQKSGSLSMPKGRVEEADGFDLKIAAQRELKEETGLDVGEFLLPHLDLTRFQDSYSFTRRGSCRQAAPIRVSKTVFLIPATAHGDPSTFMKSEASGGYWFPMEQVSDDEKCSLESGAKAVIADTLTELIKNGVVKQ
jgi:8-oxo-dGTP pyrophosphatase MutT (NUDIX family)